MRLYVDGAFRFEVIWSSQILSGASIGFCCGEEHAANAKETITIEINFKNFMLNQS